MELLPSSFKFRFTYAGESEDQTQNIETDLNVVFQTIKTVVTFKDSNGVGIPGGVVTYNGSYKFRMSYAGTSKNKTQNIGSHPIVVFQIPKR